MGMQIHWNGQHQFVPGHGNWPGEIPEVHRWAYDYGKDGREFIPQTEPVVNMKASINSVLDQCE